MIVKNVSSRLHHVGSTAIPPGEERIISDEYAGSINKAELVEVAQEVKPVPRTKKADNPPPPPPPPPVNPEGEGK
jgi:hypothetical protein